MFVQGERYFDDQGRLVPQTSYRKFDLPTLIEYGATDGLTLVLSPSLLGVAVGTERPAEYRGLGYTDVGGRLRVWSTDAHVVSVQATARLPGARRAENPAEWGWTDPETDIRALWGYGFSLYSMPAFLDAQAGYRVRAGGPADEMRIDLTLGVRPAPRWLVLVQSFNTLSVRTPRGLHEPTRSHKVAVSLAYTLGAWTVEVGALATVAGQNALQERGLTTGLWYRF
jgi:hypothetical protein